MTKMTATMLAAGEAALHRTQDQHAASRAAEVWGAMEQARLARIQAELREATAKRVRENRPWGA